MKKRVAVLMGGTSSEREVSLMSGRNVAEALASLDAYDVVPVDLREDSIDAMPRDVDAVYIALHGGWGENGGVQSALNRLKLPYTGPGVLSSQIAMDKIKTKMVLEMKGILTPAWGLASPGDEKSPLPLPVVVKPACDGSSVGVSKVSDSGEWPAALACALAAQGDGKPALVEEFIYGREMTVAVVDAEAWPVVEIIAENGWYGYDEKYRSDKTQYRFLEDGELSRRVKETAVTAYRAFGCRGVTRIDFMVSPLGRCYVLELNTSPGFTSHSLVPMAGMHAGLTFAGVCERILRSADYDR